MHEPSRNLGARHTGEGAQARSWGAEYFSYLTGMGTLQLDSAEGTASETTAMGPGEQRACSDLHQWSDTPGFMGATYIQVHPGRMAGGV